MPRRSRPALYAGLALFGFLAVLAVRTTPADPDARLPRRFRLVGLIHRQQGQAVALRRQADGLRTQLADIRRAAATHRAGSADLDARLRATEATTGM